MDHDSAAKAAVVAELVTERDQFEVFDLLAEGDGCPPDTEESNA